MSEMLTGREVLKALVAVGPVPDKWVFRVTPITVGRKTYLAQGYVISSYPIYEGKRAANPEIFGACLSCHNALDKGDRMTLR